MQQFFEKADELFLQSLRNGDLNRFATELERAVTAYKALWGNDNLQLEDQTDIAKRLLWIRECARSFLNIELNSSACLLRIRSDGETIIRAQENEKQVLEHTLGEQSEPLTDRNSSHILRHWFLENIAHPFPSTETKTQLAESTKQFVEKMSDLGKDSARYANAPTTYGQVQLWFINTRRRSQWTIFRERFADSESGRMERLCSLLSSKQTGSPDQSQSDLCRILAEVKELDEAGLLQEATECRRFWRQMINWIEQKPVEEAGTWLDDAIREGTNEYEDARRKVKEQRRRIREFQEANKAGATQAHKHMVQARSKRGRPDDETEHSQPLGRKSRKTSPPDSHESTANGPTPHGHVVRAARSVSGCSAGSSSSIPSLIDPDQTSYESAEWQPE